jgi:hypothetical protein
LSAAPTALLLLLTTGRVVLGSDRTSPDVWLLFDYSKSAGYFSQLAGVLAGFTFLAMTLLLSRQHRRDTDVDAAQEHRQDEQMVTALGCALLGLITAAALYALLAGAQAWSLASGRVLSRSVLAGVAFVFSLYTAFFAAVQLVSVVALGAHLRFIVAVITPPAVVAFIVATLDDLTLALANPLNQPPAPGEPIRPHWTPGSAGLWAYAHHGMTWSIPIVFVLCAVIWCAGLRWRHATGGVGRVASALKSVVSAGLSYLPYVSLTLVAWTVWRTALLSRLEPGAHIDSNRARWLIWTCVVILVLQSACLSLIRGADVRPDVHGEPAD